ncbi:MAG: RHS repeat protein [Nitrospira sp.]|nr:RHS repeat protein [Nitrospira sp.]
MEWLQQIDHFQRWLDRSFGRIRDPKGNLTQIAYDAKGNPLTITDALNQVTTFTYNPQGLLLTTRCPQSDHRSLRWADCDRRS